MYGSVWVSLRLIWASAFKESAQFTDFVHTVHTHRTLCNMRIAVFIFHYYVLYFTALLRHFGLPAGMCYTNKAASP